MISKLFKRTNLFIGMSGGKMFEGQLPAVERNFQKITGQGS